MAYITGQDLADWLSIQDQDQYVARRVAAVTAACISVDLHCGRMFDVPTTATARLFMPWRDCVQVDDIANTTDLVITDNGVAVDLDDLVFDPPNGVGPDGRAGWPYEQVSYLSGQWWATNGNQRTTSVTARWGWAATPQAVIEAALMVAADLYHMRDVRFGAAGYEGYGIMRLRENTAAVSLLRGYRRDVARVG